MRRITLFLAIMCLALWLSACSSTDTTGSSSASTTPTAAVSTAVTPTTSVTPTIATTTPSKQAGTSPTGVALAYYQALQVKDYNKAYTYVDANATTTQGQKLDQTSFVTLAQSQEQQWGSIQSYDALGDSTDPTMVIMTISRTQNQRYHSHLQVKNGKIVSLDTV